MKSSQVFSQRGSQEQNERTTQPSQSENDIHLLLHDGQVDIKIGLLESGIAKLKWINAECASLNISSSIFEEITSILNVEALRYLNANKLSDAFHLLDKCKDIILDYKSLNDSTPPPPQQQQQQRHPQTLSNPRSLQQNPTTTKQQTAALSLKIKEVLALTLCNMGVCQRRMGKLTSSLDTLLEALQVSQQASSRAQQGNIQLNLAILYSQLGLHDRSVEYAKKALVDSKACMNQSVSPYQNTQQDISEEKIVANIGIGNNPTEQKLAQILLCYRTLAQEEEFLGNLKEAQRNHETASNIASNNLAKNNPIKHAIEDEFHLFRQRLESETNQSPRSYNSFRVKVTENNHELPLSNPSNESEFKAELFKEKQRISQQKQSLHMPHPHNTTSTPLSASSAKRKSKNQNTSRIASNRPSFTNPSPSIEQTKQPFQNLVDPEKSNRSSIKRPSLSSSVQTTPNQERFMPQTPQSAQSKRKSKVLAPTIPLKQKEKEECSRFQRAISVQPPRQSQYSQVPLVSQTNSSPSQLHRPSTSSVANRNSQSQVIPQQHSQPQYLQQPQEQHQETSEPRKSKEQLISPRQSDSSTSHSKPKPQSSPQHRSRQPSITSKVSNSSAGDRFKQRDSEYFADASNELKDLYDEVIAGILSKELASHSHQLGLQQQLSRSDTCDSFMFPELQSQRNNQSQRPSQIPSNPRSSINASLNSIKHVADGQSSLTSKPSKQDLNRQSHSQSNQEFTQISSYAEMVLPCYNDAILASMTGRLVLSLNKSRSIAKLEFQIDTASPHINIDVSDEIDYNEFHPIHVITLPDLFGSPAEDVKQIMHAVLSEITNLLAIDLAHNCLVITLEGFNMQDYQQLQQQQRQSKVAIHMRRASVGKQPIKMEFKTKENLFFILPKERASSLLFTEELTFSEASYTSANDLHQKSQQQELNSLGIDSRDHSSLNYDNHSHVVSPHISNISPAKSLVLESPRPQERPPAAASKHSSHRPSQQQLSSQQPQLLQRPTTSQKSTTNAQQQQNTLPPRLSTATPSRKNSTTTSPFQPPSESPAASNAPLIKTQSEPLTVTPNPYIEQADKRASIPLHLQYQSSSTKQPNPSLVPDSQVHKATPPPSKQNSQNNVSSASTPNSTKGNSARTSKIENTLIDNGSPIDRSKLNSTQNSLAPTINTMNSSSLPQNQPLQGESATSDSKKSHRRNTPVPLDPHQFSRNSYLHKPTSQSQSSPQSKSPKTDSLRSSFVQNRNMVQVSEQDEDDSCQPSSETTPPTNLKTSSRSRSPPPQPEMHTTKSNRVHKLSSRKEYDIDDSGYLREEINEKFLPEKVNMFQSDQLQQYPSKEFSQSRRLNPLHQQLKSQQQQQSSKTSPQQSKAISRNISNDNNGSATLIANQPSLKSTKSYQETLEQLQKQQQLQESKASPQYLRSSQKPYDNNDPGSATFIPVKPSKQSTEKQLNQSLSNSPSQQQRHRNSVSDADYKMELPNRQSNELSQSGSPNKLSKQASYQSSANRLELACQAQQDHSESPFRSRNLSPDLQEFESEKIPPTSSLSSKSSKLPKLILKQDSSINPTSLSSQQPASIKSLSQKEDANKHSNPSQSRNSSPKKATHSSTIPQSQQQASKTPSQRIDKATPSSRNQQSNRNSQQQQQQSPQHRTSSRNSQQQYQSKSTTEQSAKNNNDPFQDILLKQKPSYNSKNYNLAQRSFDEPFVSPFQPAISEIINPNFLNQQSKKPSYQHKQDQSKQEYFNEQPQQELSSPKPMSSHSKNTESNSNQANQGSPALPSNSRSSQLQSNQSQKAGPSSSQKQQDKSVQKESISPDRLNTKESTSPVNLPRNQSVRQSAFLDQSQNLQQSKRNTKPVEDLPTKQNSQAKQQQPNSSTQPNNADKNSTSQRLSQQKQQEKMSSEIEPSFSLGQLPKNGSLNGGSQPDSQQQMFCNNCSESLIQKALNQSLSIASGSMSNKQIDQELNPPGQELAEPILEDFRDDKDFTEEGNNNNNNDDAQNPRSTPTQQNQSRQLSNIQASTTRNSQSNTLDKPDFEQRAHNSTISHKNAMN